MKNLTDFNADARPGLPIAGYADYSRRCRFTSAAGANGYLHLAASDKTRNQTHCQHMHRSIFADGRTVIEA